MYTEKREGGIYFKFFLHIADFDPYVSAVRTLKWYIDYLNRQLDTDRYIYILTHRECLLSVRLTQTEAECQEHAEQILNKAHFEIERSRPIFVSLSNGMIPDIIKQCATKQFDAILSEWQTV